MIPNTVQVVGLGAIPTSSIGFVHCDLEGDMGADGLHSGLVLFHFRSNEKLVGIERHQQLRCQSGADSAKIAISDFFGCLHICNELVEVDFVFASAKLGLVEFKLNDLGVELIPIIWLQRFEHLLAFNDRVLHLLRAVAQPRVAVVAFAFDLHEGGETQSPTFDSIALKIKKCN